MVHSFSRSRENSPGIGIAEPTVEEMINLKAMFACIHLRWMTP